MGRLDKRHHHIVDGNARNPDDQIGVSVQHAVLRVCVATRTDSAVKTYGLRGLTVLEDVARPYLFEQNLHEPRKGTGRLAVDPCDLADDLFFLFLRKRPNQRDASIERHGHPPWTRGGDLGL